MLHIRLWLPTARTVLVVTPSHDAINTAASLLLPLHSGAVYTRAWLQLVAITTAWPAVLVRRDPLF